MRLCIFGSRGITVYEAVAPLIDQALGPTVDTIEEVVSGAAPGADRLGEQWARNNGLKVAQFPADWNRFGKRAGYFRNELMAEYADAGIAIWDGASRGTQHMIDQMMRRNKPVVIIYCVEESVS